MKSSTSSAYVYLLALISPVIAVYFAVRQEAWENRKLILIFLITLFGATLILQTSDGFVLKQMIYDHYVGLSFTQWYVELKQILLFTPPPGTKGDVFSHVLSYFVGEVLHIPGQYFLFVSFLYGYLYIHAISKILRWDSSRKSALFWILIVIFVTYRFIDDLQTVRTWTGLWVLFNGVYGYYETRKPKYVFIMLAAPLFHVAYFIIVLPAFLGILLRKLPSFVFITAYSLSFFIQIPEGGIIERLKTTELGKEKVAGYYVEDSSDQYNPLEDKSANWYRKYGKSWALPNAPHFVAGALIIMGLFSNRRMTSLEFGLFSTGLLLAIIANLGDFIPAFYNRTMINAGVYILAAMALVLVRGQLLNKVGLPLQFRKFLLWCCVCVFVPYLVYVTSNVLQFTSVFMLGLPVLGFFPEINISIRELIGYLFGI